MIETGTKVELEISEPWPVDMVIRGTILRSLNSGEYFVIRDSEKDALYIVQSRYKGDKLSDIQKGREVIVGIAIPLQDLDLLTVLEITPEVFKRLDYKYIGSIKMVTVA